jgi:NitT/TauT family transport system permease protein
VAVGLVVSFVTGVLLALLASRSSMLRSLLRPVVTAIKSTPVVSIIVLALVWFSSSFVPIFSCILLCFPIYFANTLSGIQTVDQDLLELAEVFRVRRRRVIREIVVPSVLPDVYSATSICLGFSWKSVVAAEVLSSPKYSLGYELYKTKLYLETPELFAWTIAIIVISLIVEKGIKQMMPKGSDL